MSGKNANQGLRASTVQNRIKKIMQSDEDVGKVAAASTFLVACAVEKFLDTLLGGAISIAQERNAKTLTASHVKASVHSNPLLDFCKDHVANAADLPPPGAEEPAKAKRSAAGGEDGSAPKRPRSAGSGAGRGRGRGRGRRGRGAGADSEDAAAAVPTTDQQQEQQQDGGAAEDAAAAAVGGDVVDPSLLAAPGAEAEAEDYDDF